MASLHLCNAVLELLESINIHHGCWRRIGALEKGFAYEARPRANHGGKERLWDKLYHGPKVGAKCTYQNPELAHVKLDVAKVDS